MNDTQQSDSRRISCIINEVKQQEIKMSQILRRLRQVNLSEKDNITGERVGKIMQIHFSI